MIAVTYLGTSGTECELVRDMKVMMRMEFWYIWARITIAEADRSISARAKFGTSTNSAGRASSIPVTRST